MDRQSATTMFEHLTEWWKASGEPAGDLWAARWRLCYLELEALGQTIEANAGQAAARGVYERMDAAVDNHLAAMGDR